MPFLFVEPSRGPRYIWLQLNSRLKFQQGINPEQRGPITENPLMLESERHCEQDRPCNCSNCDRRRHSERSFRDARVWEYGLIQNSKCDLAKKPTEQDKYRNLRTKEEIHMKSWPSYPWWIVSTSHVAIVLIMYLECCTFFGCRLEKRSPVGQQLTQVRLRNLLFISLLIV